MFRKWKWIEKLKRKWESRKIKKTYKEIGILIQNIRKDVAETSQIITDIKKSILEQKGRNGEMLKVLEDTNKALKEV